MSEDANLFAQQEANRRRSTWLVIGFILFFAWVGFGGDLAFGLLTADHPPGSYHHVIPFIGIFTTLVAAGICWYSWRHGPQRVLWATGAWEIVEPATPEERQLVNVVEEMAIASGLPKPKVWVVPDDDPNAFATGRDPASASIAVTEGLLRRAEPRRAAGRGGPRDGAHPEPRRPADDAARRHGRGDRADVGRRRAG